MKRLQITVNIKSSSGTPGVNISQRLPTSLCFSFASYKAIKQGRKKKKGKKTFPVTGKTPQSWQQPAGHSGMNEELGNPTGQSHCCSSPGPSHSPHRHCCRPYVVVVPCLQPFVYSCFFIFIFGHKEAMSLCNIMCGLRSFSLRGCLLYSVP